MKDVPRETDVLNSSELGAELGAAGAKIPGSVWRHKKSGGYYWSGHTLAGFPKSIGLRVKNSKASTKNKAIALQVRRQIWISSNKNLGAPGLARGLEKLLGEFEKLVAMEASPNYAHRIVAHVRAFHAAKGIKHAWEINTPAIQQYLTELLATEYVSPKGKERGKRAPSTVARHRAALSRWCQWLVYQGQADANYAAAVKPPRAQRRRPRFLVRKDQAAVLRAARKTGLRNAVRFALAVGVRRGELAALRGKDVAARDVVVERAYRAGDTEHTKSYRDRTVPLRPGIVRMIRRMGVDKEALLFPDVMGRTGKRDMSKVANAVAMFNALAGRRSGRRWHLFRSTYAVMQARAGVGLWELMRRMGHSNPQTTMMYLDVAGVADAVHT